MLAPRRDENMPDMQIRSSAVLTSVGTLIAGLDACGSLIHKVGRAGVHYAAAEIVACSAREFLVLVSELK